MLPLSGRVAVVTGASRGIGRGIAVGLAEAAATVVVTGRPDPTRPDGIGADLAETARRADAAGGRAVPMPCDHRDDRAVERLFAAVAEEFGRCDVLVNNATALPDFRLVFSETPFWEVPLDVLDDVLAVGVRSAFVASVHAARRMRAAGQGLIVNISSAGAVAKFAIAPYGIGKAAVEKMTSDMAADLVGSGVSVVSLWPPASATERMLAEAGPDDDPAAWADPVFSGRVVAALAQAPDLADRSGKSFPARELATQLGVDWAGSATR